MSATAPQPSVAFQFGRTQPALAPVAKFSTVTLPPGPLRFMYVVSARSLVDGFWVDGWFHESASVRRRSIHVRATCVATLSWRALRFVVVAKRCSDATPPTPSTSNVIAMSASTAV